MPERGGVRGLATRLKRFATGMGPENRSPKSQTGAVPQSVSEVWDPTSTSELYVRCAAAGVGSRPQYLWPVLHCAHAARAIGLERISALEFGVAGGNGLLALEEAADAASKLSGTAIDVYGFDTGRGMPPPEDPRDAPWLIEPSYFEMDEAALRARLKRAELVLGPVAETVPRWSREDHAPIGFISFDVDYYSSTMAAFGLFDAPAERLLPRVMCYFDDMFGYGWSDFMGERAAIDEFNASHSQRKIAKIHGLRFELPREEFHKAWHEKLYVTHIFDHQRYAQAEGKIQPHWFEAHRLPTE